MSTEALINRLWVGSCDPRREWATVFRPLVPSGGFDLADPSEWVLASFDSTRIAADGPVQVCTAVSAAVPKQCSPVCLVGIEGAYIKPGFGKKQALAYAMRVGMFRQAFHMQGITTVIIPPAYGKGGLAWKREVGVTGMTLEEQQQWCHGMLGTWPVDEHEADAFALCHFIQTRVHKHLLIGVPIPKCLQEGVKELKKGVAE